MKVCQKAGQELATNFEQWKSGLIREVVTVMADKGPLSTKQLLKEIDENLVGTILPDGTTTYRWNEKTVLDIHPVKAVHEYDRDQGRHVLKWTCEWKTYGI